MESSILSFVVSLVSIEIDVFAFIRRTGTSIPYCGSYLNRYHPTAESVTAHDTYQPVISGAHPTIQNEY